MVGVRDMPQCHSGQAMFMAVQAMTWVTSDPRLSLAHFQNSRLSLSPPSFSSKYFFLILFSFLVTFPSIFSSSLSPFSYLLLLRLPVSLPFLFSSYSKHSFAPITPPSYLLALIFFFLTSFAFSLPRFILFFVSILYIVLFIFLF